MKPIPSPFPYFGGKRKIVAEVWQRFGKVGNYVEPFAGTAACLFARPLAPAGYSYDWRGRLVDLRGLRPGEDGRPAVYESLVKGKEE